MAGLPWAFFGSALRAGAIFFAAPFFTGAGASANFVRGAGFAGAAFTVPPFGRPLPDDSFSAMTTPQPQPGSEDRIRRKLLQFLDFPRWISPHGFAPMDFPGGPGDNASMARRGRDGNKR
jgi:hypothetical protein